MAAATIRSDLFNSDGTPKKIVRAVSGLAHEIGVKTIPTTSLDDIGDFIAMVPVPCGSFVTELTEDVADGDTHATPTLDMDVVIRVYDNSSVATDTTLHNAGTLFQSAVTGKVYQIGPPVEVPWSKDGYGEVGFKIIAAAATGAEIASAMLGVKYR